MLIVSGFIFLLCVLVLTLDGKISFSQGCAPFVEVASCLPQLVVRHARQAIRNEKQDKGSEVVPASDCGHTPYICTYLCHDCGGSDGHQMAL